MTTARQSGHTVHNLGRRKVWRRLLTGSQPECPTARRNLPAPGSSAPERATRAIRVRGQALVRTYRTVPLADRLNGAVWCDAMAGLAWVLP